MALLKFELTEQHISLCRYIDWTEFPTRKEAFDNGNKNMKKEIYDEFGLILYGKPDKEFDPMESEQESWSDKHIEEMDKFVQELPTALQIMLQTGNFEYGTYKTKHYLIEWKK